MKKETKEKPTPKHVATVEISDDKVEARSVSTVNIDEYASGNSDNVKEVQSIDTLQQEKVSETSNAEEVSSVQQTTKSVSKTETLSANQEVSIEQDSESKSVSKISIDERVVQGIKEEEEENTETLSAEQTSSLALTKSVNKLSTDESMTEGTKNEAKESTITETSTSVKASSSASLASSSTEREVEEKSVSKVTVEHLTSESSNVVTETTKSEEANVAKESTTTIEHKIASREENVAVSGTENKETYQQRQFDNVSKIQVADKAKEIETSEEKHISSISVDSENQRKQVPFPAIKAPASLPVKHITTVPLRDDPEPVAQKPNDSKGDGKSQVQNNIAAFIGTAPSTTLSDKELSDDTPVVNGVVDDVNDDEEKLNDKEENKADLSPAPTKPHTLKKPFEMEAIKEEESPLPNGHVPNGDISENDINDNVKNATSETKPLKNNHLAVSLRSSITL